MQNLVECSIINFEQRIQHLVQPASGGIRLDLSGNGVEGNSLDGTQLADILQAMSGRDDLVELILSRNDRLSGSVAVWIQCLRLFKNLKKLVLSRCFLQTRDLEDLAKFLSEIPNLVLLDLSYNWSLYGSEDSLSPYLQQLKCLQKLDFGWRSLQVTV